MILNWENVYQTTHTYHFANTGTCWTAWIELLNTLLCAHAYRKGRKCNMLNTPTQTWLHRSHSIPLGFQMSKDSGDFLLYYKTSGDGGHNLIWPIKWLHLASRQEAQYNLYTAGRGSLLLLVSSIYIPTDTTYCVQWHSFTEAKVMKWGIK